MNSVTGDFPLTMDELRAIARFAAESASDVLALFEEQVPEDARPRAAIDAAWTFVGGAARTALQRTTALDAHRAAKAAPSEVSRLAAQAAGDAAAAAYLHPIAKAHQVGHILRAAANAAYIAEIQAGGDPAASDRAVAGVVHGADPLVVDVLRRYPPAVTGRSRAAQVMSALDRAMRG